MDRGVISSPAAEGWPNSTYNLEECRGKEEDWCGQTRTQSKLLELPEALVVDGVWDVCKYHVKLYLLLGRGPYGCYTM